MLSLRTVTALLLVAGSSVLVSAGGPVKDVCGVCNPVSGQNHCDVTTSCINTGKRFHCACRAGYKASQDNGNTNLQFRLNMPNYQFLVFTPENVACNTLCDNPFGYGPDLCKEVPLQNGCVV